MKNSVFLSFLVVFSLGLFGCPYESQVPISQPSIPVDAQWLGTWNSKDEVYNSYKVSKASALEYHIEQHNIRQVSHFRGFLSEVRGNMFMNLYSDSAKTYYLYRVKLEDSGKKLIFIPLKRDLKDHFGSMDGLRNYIEKNMNFRSLYSEKDQAVFEKESDELTATALN